MLGEVDEELTTGARPTGLHEAQVLGREVRTQGQLQLAEAASRPPEADQVACGLGLLLGLDDHSWTVAGRPIRPAGVTREVIDARACLRHR